MDLEAQLHMIRINEYKLMCEHSEVGNHKLCNKIVLLVCQLSFYCIQVCHMLRHFLNPFGARSRLYRHRNYGGKLPGADYTATFILKHTKTTELQKRNNYSKPYHVLYQNVQENLKFLFMV
jgi:hypothetical protein